MSNDVDVKQPSSAQEDGARRAYEKPVLIEFGTVRELTRGGGSKSSESFPPNSRRAS